jgi:RNase P subunit RPR2
MQETIVELLNNAKQRAMPVNPTIKFQQALPYSVLRSSPSLAALYTTRTLPSLHPDSCSNCASYLLNGNATIRLVRLRQPNFVRALRRTCHACGWINEIRFNTEENPASRDVSISQQPTPAPDSLQIPRARPKKKTGLHDMLSRSREKQKEEQSRRSDGQVGLAAFLSNI